MSAELRKNRLTFIHAPILAEIVARLKAGEPALAQYLGGKQACFPRTVVGQPTNSKGGNWWQSPFCKGGNWWQSPFCGARGPPPKPLVIEAHCTTAHDRFESLVGPRSIVFPDCSGRR